MGEVAESTNQSTNQQHANPDKGLAYYPITDMQFDVVTVMSEKCKALQAYDKYIRDSRPNSKLLEVLEQIKADDKKHVEALKEFLGNC